MESVDLDRQNVRGFQDGMPGGLVAPCNQELLQAEWL